MINEKAPRRLVEGLSLLTVRPDTDNIQYFVVGLIIRSTTEYL